MYKAPSGIIHLNLKTKAKRQVPKCDTIIEEISRLERANSYIKGEPEQECYAVRNRKRIQTLKRELKSLELKGLVGNG